MPSELTAAEQALFIELQARMGSIAKQVIGWNWKSADDHTRHDIINDAVLRIILKARFQPLERLTDGFLGAYIHHVTCEYRGRYLQYQRHLQDEKQLAELRDQTMSQTAPEIASDGFDLTQVPEKVAACFRQLSEDEKRCLELKFIDGLNAAEIGDKLGKSPAAAQKLTERARNEIIDRLREMTNLCPDPQKLGN